jgi:hypothetical protein
MRCRVQAALFRVVLVTAFGCSDGKSVDSADTGEAKDAPDGWFDEAELDPPFEHGNAIWAGVAIFDFDGDGLQDLFFTNGANHPDALYRNEGDGRFVDVAPAAGVASRARHGAVAAGDLDNDGDMDLVVATECSTGTLSNDEGRAIGDGDITIYENLGDGTFLERQAAVAAAVLEYLDRCPVSVHLADLDGDGFLDLSISNGLDPDQPFPWIFLKRVPEAEDMVWLNDGQGDFTREVAAEWREGDQILNLKVVSFTTVFLDVTGDGRVDRIVGHGGAPLEVYAQQTSGEFHFSDETSEVPDGLWMGVAIADFDRDSDLDFYVTNQGLSPLISGYDNIPEVASQELFIEGETTPDPHLNGLITPFHAMVSLENSRLVLNPEWTVEADHLLAGDLFDGYPDSATGVLQYPEWLDPSGFDRFAWAWGAVALDVDADGWSDVAFTGNNCAAPMDIIWDEEHGAGPGALLLNTGEGAFTDVTWEAGIPNLDKRGRYQDGRGIATGDLNNDGYADLVVANRTYNPSQSDPLAQEPGVPHVWLSRPRDGNWLRIEIQGTSSNSQGLGSVVIVDDGSQRVAHGLGLGGATNSSSERAILLGLGSAEQVDLEVRFPSGTVVEVAGVEANQSIVVVEP